MPSAVRSGINLPMADMVYVEALKRTTMPSKRSVWIVDIHDFLMYLEAAFYQLSPKFSWLRDNTNIYQNYPWTDTHRFNEPKTQRDELIDWLIRKQLAEMYYIDLHQDGYQPEFVDVWAALVDHHDYPRQTRYYFQFPLIVGDIHPHDIRRQSYWLYVELTYDPTQQTR